MQVRHDLTVDGGVVVVTLLLMRPLTTVCRLVECITVDPLLPRRGALVVLYAAVKQVCVRFHRLRRCCAPALLPPPMRSPPV